MEEIQRDVTMDEMQYGGLFTFQGEADGAHVLVIANRPDWVRSPIDGQKCYIKDMYVASQDITCPQCHKTGRHGIVSLEGGLIVVCCTECKQFVWCAIKEG